MSGHYEPRGWTPGTPPSLTRGRCGDEAPTFIGALPEVCVLLAGHTGWHRSDQGGEWTRRRPIADRTAASDAEFTAELDRWETAPHAPEALRERVARAIYANYGEDEVSPWEDAGRALQDEMRGVADAALDVIRGQA